MRVLLVEDDATIAEFVERGLREAGFAVEVAADGRTGLQRALDEPYDAATVDVMLPQLDGLALIDTLRAITDLDPAGIAADSGLQAGDVIEKVDGQAVTTADALKSSLDRKDGKPSLLLVNRKGTTIFFTLRAH